MPYKVRLFEIPGGAPTPSKPTEVPGFAVDGGNHDLAREAVVARLKEFGYEGVRSVSALADGTADFAAIVHERTPKEKS